MKLRSITATFVLPAVLLLLNGSPVSAQRGTKKAAAAAKKANDVALILELQKTAHLLSKANRDYKGHRAEAVRQIHHAVRYLKNEAKVRGLKGAGSDYKGPEPQPVSDTQLKQAIANLKSTLTKVNSLSTTTRRTKAADRVGKAIDELNVALQVAPKDK
jgi:hypothetical protein